MRDRCCGRPNGTRCAGDKYGFSALHLARSDDCREGGEVDHSNRSGVLVTKLRRSLDERLNGNSHEFGMASVPAEAEIASGSEYRLALPVRIFGDYATSKVTPWNSRQCGLRHFSKDVLHVARIDCGGNDLHENFARLGRRHGK